MYVIYFSFIDFLDSLRNDQKKCVIVLDFTKFGIVDEGSTHCLVACVLSGPGRVNKYGLLIFIAQFADLVGIWKPSIKYYDYYAQSVKKETLGTKVKQTFPYVKVALVELEL